MYKAYLNNWPNATAGAVSFLVCGLFASLNSNAATDEFIGPIAAKEPTHATFNISRDIIGSSFGMVSSSASGDGVTFEAFPSIDEVAQFWSSLDDGTLFDDVSEATWAMINALVEKNPNIANHL